VWTECMSLRVGTSGSEPSTSIKGGKFLDWLSDCQLLKDFAPWSHLVSLGHVKVKGGMSYA
jgi:hypothetical protein